MTWFDIPKNPTSFTAANDASVNITTVFDYSAKYLDSFQQAIVLSAAVEGFVSANGGPAPVALYVALPEGLRAPRTQSFPVAAACHVVGGGTAVPIDARAITTGTVISVSRIDGGTWPEGGFSLAFVGTFAVEPKPADTSTL